MAGSFEVGSIVARLKLDDAPFMKTLKQVLSIAKNSSSQLELLFKTLQPKIDFSKFDKSIEGVKASATSLRTKLLATFNRLGLTIVRTLIVPLRGARIAFVSLMHAGVVAAKLIRSSFNRLSYTLRKFSKYIYSLNGMLAGIGVALGAWQLIKRAQEVETLEIAFRNLSASIGGVSDSLIKKLRSAVKGTVSDLELMRMANNAILLGAVKTEDEFAELALIARRLGRAIGRDTKDALADITVGIGRLSWRLLDNIGLIVRVGEANKVYAAQIGKTVRDLTDAESRQAFMNMTLAAGRQKLKEMGPDVDTLTDSWTGFTAALSNTVNLIAKAFVGAGPFTSMSRFLNENKQQILSFAKFMSASIKSIIVSFASIFGGLAKASSAEEALRELQAIIVDGIEAILSIVSGILIASTKTIFSRFGILVTKLLGGFFAQFIVLVVAHLTNAIQMASGVLAKGVLWIASKVPGVATLMGLDKPSELRRKMKRIESLTKDFSREVENTVVGSMEFIDTEVGEIIQEIGDEISGVTKDIVDGFNAGSIAMSKNKFFKAAGQSILMIRDAFEKMRIDLADPFQDFTALQVQVELQKVAVSFNELIKLRGMLQETAPELISTEEVKRSGERLERFKSQIVALSDAYTDLKNAPNEVRDAMGKRFIKVFERVRAELKDANVDINKFADDVMQRMRDVGDVPGPDMLRDGIASILDGTNIAIKGLEDLRDASGRLRLSTVGLDLFRDALDEIAFVATEYDKTFENLFSGLERPVVNAERAALAIKRSSDELGSIAKEIGMNAKELYEFNQILGRVGLVGTGGISTIRRLRSEIKWLIDEAKDVDKDGFEKITKAIEKTVARSMPRIQLLYNEIRTIGSGVLDSVEKIQELQDVAAEFTIGTIGAYEFKERVDAIGRAANLAGDNLVAFSSKIETAVAKARIASSAMDLLTLDLLDTAHGAGMSEDGLILLQEAISKFGEKADKGTKSVDAFRKDIELIALSTTKGGKGVDALLDVVDESVVTARARVQELRTEIEGILDSAKIATEAIDEFTPSSVDRAIDFALGVSSLDYFTTYLLLAAQKAKLTREEYEKLEQDVLSAVRKMQASAKGLVAFNLQIANSLKRLGLGRIDVKSLVEAMIKYAKEVKTGELTLEGYVKRVRAIAFALEVPGEAIDELTRKLLNIAVVGTPPMNEIEEAIGKIWYVARLSEVGVGELFSTIKSFSLGDIGIDKFRERLYLIASDANFVGDEMNDFVERVLNKTLDLIKASSPFVAVRQRIIDLAEQLGGLPEDVDLITEHLDKLFEKAARGKLTFNDLNVMIAALRKESSISARGITVIEKAIEAVVADGIHRLEALRQAIKEIRKPTISVEEGFDKIQKAALKFTLGDIGASEFAGTVMFLGEQLGLQEDVLHEFAMKIMDVAKKSEVSSTMLGNFTRAVLESAKALGADTAALALIEKELNQFGHDIRSGVTGIDELKDRLKSLYVQSRLTALEEKEILNSLQVVYEEGAPYIEDLVKEIERIAVSVIDDKKKLEELSDIIREFGAGTIGADKVIERFKELAAGVNKSADEINDYSAAMRNAIQTSRHMEDVALRLKKEVAGIAKIAEVTPVGLQEIFDVIDTYGVGKVGVEKLRATLVRLASEAKGSSEFVKKFGDAIDRAAKQTKLANPKYDALKKILEGVHDAAKKLPGIGELLEKAVKTIEYDPEKFSDLILMWEKGGRKYRELELEIRTIGLDDAAKEMEEFKIAFEGINKATADNDQLKRVEAARVAYKKLVDALKLRKDAIETEKVLDKLNKRLGELEESVVKARIGDLAADFKKLAREMKEALKDVPTKDADKVVDKFKKMSEALIDAKLAEAKNKLYDLRESFESVGRTDFENKMREMRNEFEQFVKAVKEASGLELPKVKGKLDEMKGTFIDMQKTVAMTAFKEAMIELQEETRELAKEIRTVGQTDTQKRVSDMVLTIEDLRKSVYDAGNALLEEARASGVAEENLEALKKKVNETREAFERRAKDVIIDVEFHVKKTEAIEELQDAMKELQDEKKRIEDDLSTIFVRDSKKDFAELTTQIERLRDKVYTAADAMVAFAERSGITGEALDKIKEKAQKAKEQLDGLAEKVIGRAEVRIEAIEAKEAAESIVRTVEDSFGNALINAFRKGESISKNWAEITGDFFEASLRASFKKISEDLSIALGKIFQSAKLGEDFATFIQGAIGLIGLMFGRGGKADTTVEDFDTAINSSEAVRGVVAGPTNVAISQIGESLKDAMRTSEILLERIAIAVEMNTFNGGGGAPNGRDLSGNAVLPLTTTTGT